MNDPILYTSKAAGHFAYHSEVSETKSRLWESRTYLAAKNDSVLHHKSLRPLRLCILFFPTNQQYPH